MEAKKNKNRKKFLLDLCKNLIMEDPRIDVKSTKTKIGTHENACSHAFPRHTVLT